MKFIQTLFSLLIVSYSINAQTFKYSDGTIQHNGAIVNTLKYEVDKNADILEEIFEFWIDDNYNVDLNEEKLMFFNKDILEAKDVVIPEISNRTIDFYARIDREDDNTSILHIYTSWGNNKWMSQKHDPIEFEGMKNIMKEFLNETLVKNPLYVSGTNENVARLITQNKLLKEEISNKKELIDKLLFDIEENKSILKLNKQLIFVGQEKLDNQLEKHDKIKSENK